MGGRGGGSSIGSKAPAPSAAPAPAPAPAPAAPRNLEQQVLDAIRNGRGFYAPSTARDLPDIRQENLVMLDSVRSQLKGFSFEQVTAELKRLDRERRIHLVTHPAHYQLSAEQKAASFRMGGKDIHAVYRI